MTENLEPVSGNEFPLNDAAYDVMTIIQNKSKALKAYECYINDLQEDTQLRQILVEIKHDDQRHIERLKAHLGRLLAA